MSNELTITRMVLMPIYLCELLLLDLLASYFQSLLKHIDCNSIGHIAHACESLLWHQIIWNSILFNFVTIKEAPQNHTCSIALPFRLLAINIYFPHKFKLTCARTPTN